VSILLWHHSSNKKLAYNTGQSETWCVGDVESGWHKSGGETETYSLVHPIPYNSSVSFIYLSTLSSTFLRIHLPLPLSCLFIFVFEAIFSASSQLALLHSIYILPKPFPFIGLHGMTEMSAESYTLTHEKGRKNGFQNFFLVSFFTSLFLEMELTVKRKH
jgi:hypothetical protein